MKPIWSQAVITLGLLLPFSGLAEPKWGLVSNDGTTAVYKGEIANSPLVGFRGTRIVNAKITKVAQILLTRDAEIRKKWIDRLITSNIIEERSPTSWVVYSSYDLPWPVEDRDFVILGTINISAPKNELLVEFHSIEHKKAPETIGVRGELTASSFRLIPLPGDRTEVTVEILADPKGNLPPFIVNFIQSRWPIVTLGALEKLSTQPNVLENEQIKPYFDGTKFLEAHH